MENVIPKTEDPYARSLIALGKCSIYLQPSRGNSGDELIFKGTEALLKNLGIRQVFDPNIADVILWPGGNPTMWEANIKGWQDCWKRWPRKKFYVGPATFQGDSLPWREAIKANQHQISGLFARDPVSMQNLEQLGLPESVEIGLSHDPAFQLRPARWIQEMRNAGTNEYVLASFRRDHESASAFAQNNEKGLTRYLPNRVLKRRKARAAFFGRRAERHSFIKSTIEREIEILWRDVSLMDFRSFVHTVQKADAVHTDRLHCMIISVLLNKKTYAYGTSYGKLESIYNHSIKDWHLVEFPEK